MNINETTVYITALILIYMLFKEYISYKLHGPENNLDYKSKKSHAISKRFNHYAAIEQ